jgi:protein ImuB
MTGASLSCRRILALRLPRLPTDRLRRTAPAFSPSAGRNPTGAPAEPAAPLAVFAAVGNARRLVAVDARAEALGLAPGQAVAEARARVPDLVLVDRDPAGERTTLEKIADWCDRWTPLVGLDDFAGEAGLLLDVAGVPHLFGGEAALCGEIVGRLAARGFAAAAAIAGTPVAARAIARHATGEGEIRVIEPGGERAAVASLPVGAIDPDATRVAALAKLGLKRVGDLLERPRAGLARRFGGDLPVRLDEAVGLLDRPIVPRRPVPDLVAERRPLEPLPDVDDCLVVLRSLAESLVEGLERRGQGLRRAEFALWRVDGSVVRREIGTGRPSRDAALLARLVEEKLHAETAGIDPGYGFDLVRLSVLAAAPLDPTQADLSGDDRGEADFDRLIDRLGARFGGERLAVARPGRSRLPEAAAVARPAGGPERGGWPEAAPTEDEPPARPLRLLPRPEPIDALAALPDGLPLRFRWRRALYEVERAEGPERIAPEWWRLPIAPPVPAESDADPAAPIDLAAATRDYFRVEERDGRRFWIFRAGLFGRETMRPRWYLHGIFG